MLRFLFQLSVCDSVFVLYVFYVIADFLRLYTKYVVDYNESLTALNSLKHNESFQRFLQKAKQDKTNQGNLDLMSLMIMPVQRIPRYELLLREYIKYTPKQHKDLIALNQSLEKIKSIAVQINEHKRHVENMSDLLMYQNNILGLPTTITLFEPTRRLLKTGTLISQSSSGSETIGCVLFNDLLLCHEENEIKKFRWCIKLGNGMKVQKSVAFNTVLELFQEKQLQPGSSSNERAVIGATNGSVSTTPTSFFFDCGSKDNMTTWLTLLQDCINNSSKLNRNDPSRRTSASVCCTSRVELFWLLLLKIWMYRSSVAYSFALFFFVACARFFL